MGSDSHIIVPSDPNIYEPSIVLLVVYEDSPYTLLRRSSYDEVGGNRIPTQLRHYLVISVRLDEHQTHLKINCARLCWWLDRFALDRFVDPVEQIPFQIALAPYTRD